MSLEKEREKIDCMYIGISLTVMNLVGEVDDGDRRERSSVTCSNARVRLIEQCFCQWTLVDIRDETQLDETVRFVVRFQFVGNGRPLLGEKLVLNVDAFLVWPSDTRPGMLSRTAMTAVIPHEQATYLAGQHFNDRAAQSPDVRLIDVFRFGWFEI